MADLSAPAGAGGGGIPTVIVIVIVLIVLVAGVRLAGPRLAGRRSRAARAGVQWAFAPVASTLRRWLPAGWDARSGKSTGQAAKPQRDLLVRRLVLTPSRHAQLEPRLPRLAVISSGWHNAFYHGSAGSPRGGHLMVRAAAVRGVAHAVNAESGQDAVGTAWNERRKALFIVVADGLGALPRSGEAARRATNTAVKLYAAMDRSKDFHMFGRQLFHDVASDVKKYISAGRFDAATTLVAAEMRLVQSGAVISVCGVGDSEAWLLHDEQWRVLHHERGQGEENTTRQLPGYPKPLVSKRVRAPVGSVLLLATDGFAAALASEGSPLTRELARRWRKTPSAMEFLAHVDFVEDVFTDDRAVVAVWIR